MKVLWIPIFSMRSYETGKYAITKDGNFQLTLARVLASDFDHITIAIPFQVSDFEEFIELDAIVEALATRDIEFKLLNYGANAVDTRKIFWRENQEFFYSPEILEFDLVITDITGYSGSMSYDLPFINNFNVTKLPELNRSYIDQFFDLDLVAMNNALFTTVINPRQREYILEVAPHLADKVMAYTKVAHSDLLPVDHTTKLFTPCEDIFWPFRISDKAYQFEEFLKMYYDSGLYKTNKLIVSDPNNSFDWAKVPRGSSSIELIKPSKEEYYKILAKHPYVIMLDDIDTVLHPGTIELMYYGVKLITYENKLIPHKGMITDIVQIPQKMTEMGYNSRINTYDFIYDYKEVSKLYSQEHINTCLQNS